jgi:hypothetical protein
MQIGLVNYGSISYTATTLISIVVSCLISTDTIVITPSTATTVTMTLNTATSGS